MTVLELPGGAALSTEARAVAGRLQTARPPSPATIEALDGASKN
jgi:hypothetical protein